jgi:hypothetical protein
MQMCFIRFWCYLYKPRIVMYIVLSLAVVFVVNFVRNYIV